MKCAFIGCGNDLEVVWPVTHKKFCSYRCQQASWRSNNRARIAEQQRQRRIENHDAVRAREKKSRAKNVEQHRAWGRNAWRRKQGLASTETKSGDCEICKNFCERLHYDHDHKTGLWRGWLCPSCNMKLAWFEKFSDAAARYLGIAARREALR